MHFVAMGHVGVGARLPDGPTQDRYVKSELCRNCVRWARNRRRIPTFTGSHREAFCGGKSLNRLREEVFQYRSVILATIAFQACSFNHSDISPFRINHLRAAWNSVAQNPPYNPDCPRTRSDSATCERTRIDDRENCVRPSNLLRSLTAISPRLVLREQPAADCNGRTDRLHDPEWPGTLKEAVGRAERTRDGKREHEPRAALFEGVGDQHRRDGEQAKSRKRCHAGSSSASRNCCVPSGPSVSVSEGPDRVLRSVRTARTGSTYARRRSWSQATRAAKRTRELQVRERTTRLVVPMFQVPPQRKGLRAHA